MQFLLQGLDSLVKTISDNEDNFNILKQSIGKKYKYLKRKGVYPYDYFDSFLKFEGKNSLQNMNGIIN